MMCGLKTNHTWSILWFTVNCQMNALSLHGCGHWQKVGSSPYSLGPYECSVSQCGTYSGPQVREARWNTCTLPCLSTPTPDTWPSTTWSTGVTTGHPGVSTTATNQSEQCLVVKHTEHTHCNMIMERLCCCIVALCILRERLGLQNCSNGRNHYFSLVVWRGVKQCFTVVGQAWFVCFTFVLCHSNSSSVIMAVVWRMRWGEGQSLHFYRLSKGSLTSDTIQAWYERDWPLMIL